MEMTNLECIDEKTIKNNIEYKRRILNELMLNDNINKECILKLSIELDKLIYKYYCKKYNNKNYN
ncbi:Spo0E family sporulation regulatory protein-aspartic acid phosphatase [Dethiothermospora halolimnae]|uniref:Spo0E family sporulation regulatory protein-aspartic acid phosphatase n=1 Tax=Dethiothermospora halolimnae TaxID=3114390 RepID=UPI003CCBDFAD